MEIKKVESQTDVKVRIVDNLTPDNGFYIGRHLKNMIEDYDSVESIADITKDEQEFKDFMEDCRVFLQKIESKYEAPTETQEVVE